MLILILSIPILVSRKIDVIKLVRSQWLLVAAVLWATISTLWAISPDISIRRLLGTGVILLISLSVATIPPAQIIRITLLVTGVTMALNFLGILFLSHASISADGFWEGLHTTKNGAGYIASISIIIWVSSALEHRKPLQFVSAVLFLVFLLMTSSRTSILLIVPSVAIAFFLHVFIASSARFHTFLYVMIASIAAAMLLVLFAYIASKDLLLNLSLSGRLEIWNFVWHRYLERPLVGWGYQSFWGIGDEAFSSRVVSSAVSDYTQAHNGYLDMLATTGLVGLILVLAPFAGLPRRLAAYVTSQQQSPPATAIVISGITLVGFMLAHNAMESSLLQGLHPVWTIALLHFLSISNMTRRP